MSLIKLKNSFNIHLKILTNINCWKTHNINTNTGINENEWRWRK